MSLPREDIERLGNSVNNIRMVMELLHPEYSKSEVISFDELLEGLNIMLPDYRQFVRDAVASETSDPVTNAAAIEFSEEMTVEDLCEIFVLAGIIEINSETEYSIRSNFRDRWKEVKGDGGAFVRFQSP
jgi:hypothetical protein